jgi:hypothetical protein
MAFARRTQGGGKNVSSVVGIQLFLGFRQRRQTHGSQQENYNHSLEHFSSSSGKD